MIMTSKPRPSVLDLFDPLLAEAVRVPIPESPPTTPQKPLERGVENKENLAPNELTMSVFFDRISRSTYTPTMKTTNVSSGLLVELEDPEVGPEDGQTHASPRVPLTDLSVDDFSTPTKIPMSYGLSHKKTSSGSDPSFSGTPLPPSPLRHTQLPPSPLRQTQLASSLFPTISVNGSQDDEGSLIRSTHIAIEPAHGHETRRGCHGLQTPPPKGLLLHKQSRRRSSIDISTTLSLLSSGSFHLPDASFDLVNGEISFLNKSSEELDTDHDIRFDSLKPQRPHASLSPQTSISEGGDTVGLSMEHWSEDISLTNTYAQPSAGEAEVLSQFKLAPSHGQPTLPTGSARNSGEEHRPVQAFTTESTTIAGGQDTPPGARRVSSVPAPVKKLRVFTSKHHHTTFAVTKRGTTGVVATSSATSLITTKKSSQGSTAGGDTSCHSGIPRGSAGHNAGIDGTEEHHRRKPPVSKGALNSKPLTSNIKVPSRTICPAVNREGTAERASRITTSRLPGPAAGRTGTVTNYGTSRRTGSAQNVHGIPVRSAAWRERHHQLDSEKPTAL